MQIKFSGQVTRKEYTRAITAHYHPQFKWTKILSGVVIVFGILSLIFSAIDQRPDRPQTPVQIIVPFLIFMTFPWWTPFIQSLSYNNKGNIYHSPISGVIADEGITVINQNMKTNFLWSAFTHYIEKDGLIMIYQGKNCFNIFTRSLFTTAEEWDQFRNLLSDKYSNKQR